MAFMAFKDMLNKERKIEFLKSVVKFCYTSLATLDIHYNAINLIFE